MNAKEQRKKERERIHLESFIKVMRLPWTVVRPGNDQDEPDFFVNTPGGVIGVEMTQLFADRKAGMAASPKKAAEMRRAGKLRRLADDFYRISRIPAHVQFTRFDEEGLADLPAQLVGVVSDLTALQSKRVEFSDDLVAIVQRLPDALKGYNRWQITSDRVGWVGRLEESALEAAISPKRRRLKSYKKSATRVVLLVVVDRTWPSGMIKNAAELTTQRGGFEAIYLHELPYKAYRLDA